MANNFEPHLIVRLMPAAYKREKLPPEVISDEATAIEYGSQRAKHYSRKGCLALDEVTTFWFNEQGLYFEVAAKTPT